MAHQMSGWRFTLAAIAIGFAVSLAAPASAQQPSSVNPTASSVKEEQLLDALKPGGAISGRISIPDASAANLIQPGGQTWRDFQQKTLPWIGGIAILGMLALLAVFYAARGAIMIDGGRSGRTLLRFSAIERFVHWMTASSFVVLAISGLNLSFGRSLILPLMGENAFGAMSAFLKLSHDYIAFPFMIGIAFMLVMWIKDNIPGAVDVRWIAEGGGLVGDKHPPAPRFNAGQKMIFWLVVLGGAVMSFTGWNMLFPNAPLAGGVSGLHVWASLHAAVGMLLIAAIFAHIYIGTIGMEGAFDAMGTGQVDLNWAKEHHSLWVDEQLGKGKSAPAAKMMPAE